MATPRVSLKSRTLADGTKIYYLDYRVNGKRMRPAVGTSKRDAELLRASIEHDLLLGTYQLRKSRRSTSLEGLVKEFLEAKELSVRSASHKRYHNYLDPFVSFFRRSFPTATGDVTLIETAYIRKFVEEAVERGVAGEKPWSRRTTNDALKIIRSLFLFAVDAEYLLKNPAQKIKELKIPSKGKPTFFTDEELERVWNTVEGHWLDPLKFVALAGLDALNIRGIAGDGLRL